MWLFTAVRRVCGTAVGGMGVQLSEVCNGEVPERDKGQSD